jgi:DNA-binding beta-propeller fold protein YncE
LERVQTISLGALDGRLDHMCMDVQNNLLYVAALTHNSLEVVDLKQGKRVHSVTDPKGPQGVMLLPESHEIVVSSGADGVFRVYDDKPNLVRFLGELKNADNVRYDGASGRVFLGYAKALAVIDPKIPSKLANIPLGGHPESFQVEKDGSNIYVNVPEAREVVVINKGSLQITAHWQMLEARENYPMALDETNHRLFVGCRSRAMVLIYDTKSGSYVGKVDCVNDADDLQYDSEHKRILVTGGQGYITVIKQVDPYLYKAEANITTSVGARTSCFEPSTGTLYLAVPHHRDQPAEIWVYKARL